MRKKLGAMTFLLVLALATTVGVRTWRFAPAKVADAIDIHLPAAPAVDTAAAAARLGVAIRFQTVSHQNPAQNQRGEWEQLQAWLVSAYPRAHAGMRRELVAGDALLYTWPGSDASLQPIILMAHQDVVPVTAGTERDWKYPPFSGQIAEGAVWGRGSMDDKGSLIAIFEAIDQLVASGFKPRRSVLLVSGADEEQGGAGARAIAAQLAARQVKALFALDEGSLVVTDAPVTNKPLILIGVAEKGYATLKVSATASGGHSSMPPRELATIALAKAVIAINERQFPLELRSPASDTLDALAANGPVALRMAAANSWLFGAMIRRQFGATPAGAAALHTTIAPTMLAGSPMENVLPQMATALINYRIAPWNSSSAVMERARTAVADLPVRLSWNSAPREPSPVSSSRSTGWKLVRAAAEAQDPQTPVAPYLVVAATDGRSFAAVSEDVYRFFPARLTTSEVGMIHGSNEHLTLDNLARMIRFYSQLIVASAG
jgi:carboxypeptidase PM20D1